jgi:hypothetical protein
MRITLSLPDHLAARFLAAVPSRRRSSTVAKLLEREITTHETHLDRACHAANADDAPAAEIEEWQSFDDHHVDRAPRGRPAAR